METLTTFQLSELKKRATSAVKERRISFFDQLGVRKNFPWLTSELARKRVVEERRENWDVAITGGFLASMFLSVGIAVAAGDRSIAFVTYGLSLPGAMVAMFRAKPWADDVITKGYKDHGGVVKRHQTDIEIIDEFRKREKLEEKKQLEELLLSQTT